MTTYDVCVIGAGGVIGSAVARELARKGLSVIALEKHDGPARELSGLNSRVIHSGFHETPETLKAKLALSGSRMLADYASQKGIRLMRTGMLIALPKDAIRSGLLRELGSLWHMWRAGRSHDVEFRWIYSNEGIRRLAPIEAAGGIFIPSVCVIDVMQLITSLQRDAIEHRAEIRYGTAVCGIRINSSDYLISTPTGEFRTHSLINSAGLGAVEVSKMAGGPEYSVELWRGQYYELRGGIERWGIRTLVYPAMPRGSKSKGIHFGPRTDGRLFLGPDAVSVDSPAAPKQLFVQAAQRFIPQITENDLAYSCEGLRPKYIQQNGVSDFRIALDRTTPALINLIGIDSPGLSASMAIGQYVGTILMGALPHRLDRAA